MGALLTGDSLRLVSDDLRGRLDALTRRQRDVLDAVVKGLTNEDIGAVLSISPATVKTHLAAIYRVLDVSNRTEAVGLLAELEPNESPSASARRRAPAIAVIPFATTGAEQQRVFAEAIAEDLISRLSRQWFPVISRGSSFLVRADGGYDPHKAGRDLGAAFLVEGRVDQGDQRVQIHARVVDAESGRVVWGDRFRSARTDLFSVQDELCGAIVESIGNAVVGSIALDTVALDVTDLQAWELAARGMWHYWRATPIDNTRARSLAERALSADPGLKLGLYTAALSYQRQVAEQWGRAADAVAGLSQAAARFAEMHPIDPWASVTRGYASLYVGDFGSALGHVIMPSPASAAYYYSWAVRYVAFEKRLPDFSAIAPPELDPPPGPTPAYRSWVSVADRLTTTGLTQEPRQLFLVDASDPRAADYVLLPICVQGTDVIAGYEVVGVVNGDTVVPLVSSERWANIQSSANRAGETAHCPEG